MCQTHWHLANMQMKLMFGSYFVNIKFSVQSRTCIQIIVHKVHTTINSCVNAGGQDAKFA